ncbi:hypothetical protein B0H19DRAFT_1304103 [Mycena capillaripes]|nr:hypothetical protein B0H19DRAFT_1304103 [Mycena capillaripes]
MSSQWPSPFPATSPVEHNTRLTACACLGSQSSSAKDCISLEEAVKSDNLNGFPTLQPDVDACAALTTSRISLESALSLTPMPAHRMKALRGTDLTGTQMILGIANPQKLFPNFVRNPLVFSSSMLMTSPSRNAGHRDSYHTAWGILCVATGRPACTIVTNLGVPNSSGRLQVHSQLLKVPFDHASLIDTCHNGPALTLYGVNIKDGANIPFSLDNVFRTYYYYDGRDMYTKHAPFFDAENLTNESHTVAWTLGVGPTGGSIGLFDYAILPAESSGGGSTTSGACAGGSVQHPRTTCVASPPPADGISAHAP